MTDLHFKHVLYEITLVEGKKGGFALNKQVDLARIVLLEAGFHLLYTQVQRLLALDFCIGTVTTQNIIKFVYLRISCRILQLLLNRKSNYYC